MVNHINADSGIRRRSQTFKDLVLGYVFGTPFFIPVDIIRNAPVCSDQRGYWGDYDSMLQTGWQDASSVWMRFLTDSSRGCSNRWEYNAEIQGIQQANYAY